MSNNYDAMRDAIDRQFAPLDRIAQAVKQPEAVNPVTIEPDKEPTPYVHRRYGFSIEDADEKEIATATIVEQSEILTLYNVWSKHPGLAHIVLESVLQAFGHRRIKLTVQPFAHAPLNEQQLMAWYEEAGFVATDVPYVMVREPRTGFTIVSYSQEFGETGFTYYPEAQTPNQARDMFHESDESGYRILAVLVGNTEQA